VPQSQSIRGKLVCLASFFFLALFSRREIKPWFLPAYLGLSTFPSLWHAFRALRDSVQTRSNEEAGSDKSNPAS